MPKQKNISFVLAIFILVDSTLLLVMQFAINPVFQPSKGVPAEISVSLKLPEMEGCVCPEVTCSLDENNGMMEEDLNINDDEMMMDYDEMMKEENY